MTNAQILIAFLVLVSSIVGVVLMNRLADERSVAKSKAEAAHEVQFDQKTPRTQATDLPDDSTSP